MSGTVMCMVVTILVGVKVNRWLSRDEEGCEGVARVGKELRSVREGLRSMRERSYEGEESPLKKEESSLKKEESPLKKEESSLKKEESPLKKEESSLKKEESPLKKEESPSANEDTPAERKGTSQHETKEVHTQQNHPISSDFAFTLMKGTDSKESSRLETERELESSLRHRRKSSSSSPVSF